MTHQVFKHRQFAVKVTIAPLSDGTANIHVDNNQYGWVTAEMILQPREVEFFRMMLVLLNFAQEESAGA